MYIQRKKDRRSSNGKIPFPVKTKSGRLIKDDRRCIPDRRLGNIHLETVGAEIFDLPEYCSDASYPAGKWKY